MTSSQLLRHAAIGYIERNTPHLVRDEIRTLVSERDELASRVRELEANARRYEWLRAQHWSNNKLGVVLRPMDNTKLGCFIPSLELLDDTIDHMSAALSSTPPESKP